MTIITCLDHTITAGQESEDPEKRRLIFNLLSFTVLLLFLIMPEDNYLPLILFRRQRQRQRLDRRSMHTLSIDYHAYIFPNPENKP